MEQQILFKIQELKKLFNNNINNFEDFLKNKEFIIYIMEQIELFINQNFNNNISSIGSYELNKKKEYNYDSFDYKKRDLDDKYENQNTINSNNEVENKEENKISEIQYSKNNNNNINIDKKTYSTDIQSNYLPIENKNYENLNNINNDNENEKNNNNDIDNEKNNNLNNSKNFTSFRPQLNFNYDEDFISQKEDNNPENNMNIMDNISDIKSENSTQKKNYITNSPITDSFQVDNIYQYL